MFVAKMTSIGASDRWQLPRRTLPGGTDDQWWVADGRLTRTPIPDAEVLPGVFVSPGLVDAHTHLFIKDYAQCDLDVATATLTERAAEGVLLLRDLGAPVGASVADLPQGDQWPRVVGVGPWLATDEFFTDGRHKPVAPDALPHAVADVVESGWPWVKVVADWDEPRLTFPAPVLREAVDVAHRAGARVAAHASSPVAARAAIDAGVDSIEHAAGAFDVEMLREMADRGIAWVPTLAALEHDLAWARGVIAQPAGWRDALVRQATKFAAIFTQADEKVSRALEAAVRHGVTVLAGPDNGGTVAREVSLLARYGLSPDHAFAAATTDARSFLRVRGLEEGAPADVVTYHDDPRADLGRLGHPAAVLIGGRL